MLASMPRSLYVLLPCRFLTKIVYEFHYDLTPEVAISSAQVIRLEGENSRRTSVRLVDVQAENENGHLPNYSRNFTTCTNLLVVCISDLHRACCTRMLLQYKLRSSYLRNSLPLDISSLPVPDILLSTFFPTPSICIVPII